MLGLHGDGIVTAAGDGGGEGKCAIGAAGEIIAAIVLQDEALAATETADGAADGVGGKGCAGNCGTTGVRNCNVGTTVGVAILAVG